MAAPSTCHRNGMMFGAKPELPRARGAQLSVRFRVSAMVLLPFSCYRLNLIWGTVEASYHYARI